jgi:hypothetical protein
MEFVLFVFGRGATSPIAVYGGIICLFAFRNFLDLVSEPSLACRNSTAISHPSYRV